MKTRNRDHYNYLTVANGRLVEKVNEDTPGAIKRMNKNDKVVYERFYDEMEGILINVKKRTSEFGDQLDLTILSDDEKVILSLGLEGKNAHDFFCQLPNMIPGEEYIFSPWSMNGDEDTKRTGLIIKRSSDESRVENFFIKKDQDGKFTYLNGYPVFGEEYSEANKKKYQAYKLLRLDWMEGLMFSKYIPEYLKGLQENVTSESTAPANTALKEVVKEEHKTKEEKEDDLPF